MEEFSIIGENDNHIIIEFTKVFGFPEKTSHFGGYELQASLKIKSGNFNLKSSYYTSTGELFMFYEQLKKINEKVSGKANYSSYEANLKLDIEYDKLGHVNVSGSFIENTFYNNKLSFEFETDQTFITQTINDLKVIVDKYGGLKGVKN